MTTDGLATSLGHGIWQIPLPLPFPGLRWTHAYLIEGSDALTLVDCGVDTGEGFDALQAGVTAAGHRLGDVRTLIGTHLHPDHIGMASRLVDELGCRLVMHEAAGPAVSYYNDWSIYRERLQTLAAEHGVPDGEQQRIGAREPRPSWAGTARKPHESVIDGSEVPVDRDRSLGVIHTPGHETSHICLIDSRTGVLFSGDHILPRITPVISFDPEADRLGEYLESLARIERLDIGLTYPAHVAILERGSLRARQIALHHERRLGGIIQELRSGPATAWEILQAIFRPNLGPTEIRLAFGETLAHLEYLHRRDEVHRFRENSTWYYRQPSRRR